MAELETLSGDITSLPSGKELPEINLPEVSSNTTVVND